MPLLVSSFAAGKKFVVNKRIALFSAAATVLLCCCFSWSQTAAPIAEVRTLQGVVKSGDTPVPGATVTAINPATGQKVVGWTQPNGSYKLSLPGDGEYVVRVQMAAFATAVAQVTVGPSNQNPRVDLEIVLLSHSQYGQGNMQGRTANRGMENRGFQSLSVLQGEAGGEQEANGSDSVTPSGMPVPGVPPTIATESVAVSGSNSPSLAGMSADELRSRYQQDGQPGGITSAAGGPMGGGFGGPGGRGGGGGPMRMGGRGANMNQPHGTIYYSANDAALNAAPFSLTSQPAINPAYLQQRFGAAIGGPLIIPHIYNGASKTFFFLHYNGTLGDTPYSFFSTVPTLLERSGNFSQTLVNGQPVKIFNPATGLPFANDTIPQGMINPAAQGLLAYIPLPNLPGQIQNFRNITAAKNDSNDFNIRLNQALGGSSAGPGRGRNRGPQNNLNVGFHYHESDQTLTDPYPSVGGTTITHGYDVPVGYVRSFGRLINNFRVDYNRSTIQTNNLYASNTDITGLLGITGVSQNPLDWGLPNLSFSHFGSLQDTNPVSDRNQTVSFTDQMIYTHKKHTLRWGGDFRRLEVNTDTASNPRGSFVFTGLNTSEFIGGTPVTETGFDFADFLLGLPQQTSVQYGGSAYGYHFRGNSWDLYAQDEWRFRSNLTFNIGLRYEYVSPFSEINNRMANLNIAPGLAAVAPVLPGQVGPLTGTAYPITLVNPDRNNFAPRMGIAWKTFKETVVRAGYGINYNTTAYSNIAQDLAFQPPFSITQTNVESQTTHLTLQNGFPPPPVNTVTNNYAINVNYPLGYVQIWNLDIQQTITPTLVLNLDYTGTKGTHLDLLDAPNRTPLGLLVPTVPAFYYEDSVADSNANAGTVRLRKRLAHGISLGGTYTWSKSLDNASTIGAGSALVSPTGTITGQTLVAQNPFNLKAEYGLSSFDQRNKFTADYLWELPFGHEKRWLTQPSIAREVLGDWQWSGDWTIASGFPFTPRILGSFGDVNSGVNGTLRPDVTSQPVSLSDPSIAEWFNTAAFVAPPLGQYGDARRNSIEGPSEVMFDMAMTKVFPLKESRMFEVRMSATNVFNHPVYTSIDTVLNSPTFGRVISVGAMRSMLMTARFRF
ncbi:MAG: TonB-dependent receptor [Candidatus Korobacteraceae bacterium]